MLIDFTPDQRVYPFESRWFESSRGKVHFIDEGSGPPILLCHGSPAWSLLYRDVIPALRSSYRCIAVDYLGFGPSERPEGFGYTIGEHTKVVGELIDNLELDDLIVMGHDWGGPIGVGAAIRRAAQVRGVVLGNTALWPIDPLPNRMFSAFMSTTFMQRQIVRNNFLVDRVLARELRGHVSPLVVAQYRAAQPTPEARVGLTVMPREIREARDLLAELRDDVKRHLAHKPALAIWGMRDPVFRPAHCLPRLRELFDDLTIVELPNARHYIQEEAPRDVARAIASRFPR